MENRKFRLIVSLIAMAILVVLIVILELLKNSNSEVLNKSGLASTQEKVDNKSLTMYDKSDLPSDSFYLITPVVKNI